MKVIQTAIRLDNEKNTPKYHAQSNLIDAKIAFEFKKDDYTKDVIVFFKATPIKLKHSSMF